MLNNIRQDLLNYNNDFGAQGFWVMVVYRFGRWRYSVKPALFRKFFSLIYKLLYKLIQIVTGIEFPCEVEIGENFIIDHFGGIVVSGYAKFGNHCRIRNGVVVGLKNVEHIRAPIFGDYVDIGAGAKILGDIRIGNHVHIGANAVVLSDVPDYSIAVGVPAKIKQRNSPIEKGQKDII